jgi:hypothetical protein
LLGGSLHQLFKTVVRWCAMLSKSSSALREIQGILMYKLDIALVLLWLFRDLCRFSTPILIDTAYSTLA